MLWVFTVFGLIAVSAARPSEADTLNVVVVPPNCPAGQEWVNGQCRDVWRLAPAPVVLPAIPIPAQYAENAAPNFVDSEAQPADEYAQPTNAVIVPPNCRPNQVYVNNQCRDIFVAILPQAELRSQELLNEVEHKNIVTVPNQCPIGYKPDALGVCREIF
ncbi:uncharacterized protein LOC135071898 [Ostrinia nubilalis]